MSKPIITHVISDSNIGGAGVLLTGIVSALKDYFDIKVFLPENAKLTPYLKHVGATVYQLPMASDKSFLPRDLSSFTSIFKGFKTDIVHTHGALSARLGAKIAGVKLCLSTRHCAIPTTRVQKKSILHRIVYNYCTDYTISTANFAKENLISEGIPDSKIITIRNGVKKRTKTSPEGIKQLKKQLGIYENGIVLGSCARLERVKGQDLMIQALPYLLKRFPKLFLVLVGDGSERKSYERLAGRLGVLPRVKFCGFISDPTPYQSIFDINLNASRGTETSCLATSECMSMGIPTVASNFGGNTEMIIPYKNGLLFESDNMFSLRDALSELLCDKELYPELCLGALEVYENSFSEEKMKNEYIRTYESLLSYGTAE